MLKFVPGRLLGACSWPGRTAMTERRTIGLREVRSLQPGQVVWDKNVPGFGARRQKSESITFVVFYRTKAGRQRWVTIGRYGAMTPTEAREEARRILSEVVRGGDPAGAKQTARAAPTVSELCGDYLASVEAGRLLTRLRVAKRPSTVATDKGRIERHIKPLLGHLKVAAVTRNDIERFRDAVTGARSTSDANPRTAQRNLHVRRKARASSRQPSARG